MNKKGLETRKLIINKAQTLFEEKGFKEITMKDICETTGLSRGGLYCHYESTEQIFLEIINSFLDSQEYDFDSKMQDSTPAVEILNIILEKYKLEMLDSSKSLSLAIYEYFSSKGKDNEQNFLKQQYFASFSLWKKLIEYGIMRGEFNSVDIQTIFDFIIFSYQGIRMYSKLMDIDEGIPNRIIGQIKSLLLIEKEKSKLNEKLLLVKPTKAYKFDALEYRREHFSFGEKIINGSELFDKIEDYDEWLTKIERNANAETVDKNWVLTDTFFAIRKNDKKIIGIIDLRYRLNGFLKDFGHCGYSVRPSERNKGYATEMLSLICKLAKKAELNILQLSVEKENISSIKTITKNGGIYQRSFEFEGSVADVYSIYL